MTKSLQKVLKAVQVLTGCSVVVLGVYNFISSSIVDFRNVVLNIYFVFFGLILMLAGALGSSATPILKYFAFLSNWFGIGAYQLWLGLLCIDNLDFSHVRTWIGVASVVCGGIGMVVHCSTKSSDQARKPLLG